MPSRYVDDVKKKVLGVLITIFEGDMLEVYGAFAAIYPDSWQKELASDERDWVPEIAKASKKY